MHRIFVDVEIHQPSGDVFDAIHIAFDRLTRRLNLVNLGHNAGNKEGEAEQQDDHATN